MNPSRRSSALGPELRAALVAMVRKRVPEAEVEDIVQSALAEAIDSPNAPEDDESLRRWVFGVAKHKVIDYHRRAIRESFDVPDVTGAPAPHVEADLLRWAERNVPGGDENRRTLDWMLREGEGEKLESIAASEKVPAPRVRQRVSRLRRHLKENWQREVALLAAVGVVLTALVVYLARRGRPDEIGYDPIGDRQSVEGARLRRDGLERCERGEWRLCVETLDRAKQVDPPGDLEPAVTRARAAAASALEAPPPGPSASVVPPPVVPLDAPPEATAPRSAPPAPTESSAPTPRPTGSAAPLPVPTFKGDVKPTSTAAPPLPTKSDVKSGGSGLGGSSLGDSKPSPKVAPSKKGGSSSEAPPPQGDPIGSW